MRATSKAKHGRSFKHGCITTINEIGLIRRMPDMTGTCPLLLADLSDEMGMPGSRLPISLHCKVVHTSEQSLLSFRLQIGATLVLWITDPLNPKVLGMLEQWASVQHMFFALKTNAGFIVRSRGVSGVAPTIENISKTPAQMDTGRFLRSFAEALDLGLLKAEAQSDIASAQKIRKLRVFLVSGSEDATIGRSPV